MLAPACACANFDDGALRASRLAAKPAAIAIAAATPRFFDTRRTLQLALYLHLRLRL
jgi:hypothetical protein